MLLSLIGYVHAMSLALWFCGLFGYVMIVWPSIFKVHAPALPRDILVQIGTATAPWIYLAMVCALGSFLLYWALSDDIPATLGLIYLVVLLLLIANNLYGSFRAWPTIMMAPDQEARAAWKAFYIRMFVSMVVGLSALSVTIFVV